MIDYTGIAEEELKLRVAEDFFPQYDTAHRIGKIDFAVTLRNPQPATRNPQPATRNPQPATRNPQPATRNPQPATRRAMQQCCSLCFGQKPSAAR